MVPGYLLVCPRRHVLSTASLTSDERLDLWACVRTAAEAIFPEFGPQTVFEHGSCANSGSCIEHAHLHVIPSTRAFELRLEQSLPWTRLKDLEDLEELAGHEYVLMQNRRGKFVLPNPGVPSQWIRRMLGNHLGSSDWDWALSLGEGNLLATLSSLGMVRACEHVSQ